jgi:hypothetical protein
MGLRPTHRDESPFLAPIDSKWVMRDFRRSVICLMGVEKVIEISRLRPSAARRSPRRVSLQKFHGSLGRNADSVRRSGKLVAKKIMSVCRRIAKG